MIFNSFQFLWLFPIIFIVYYICNSIVGNKKQSKLSNYLLLIISYLLYLQWNPACTLVLLGVTLCTYFGAIFIEEKERQKKRIIAFITLILGTFPLLFFKYYNFISSSINEGFAYLGIEIGLNGINLAIPLGLSFYTFQAIGYVSDVYSKKVKAERNLPDYMLFIAFFPQIFSGPISKASSLLPQIKANRNFDYLQAVQGLKWLLWGFFMKVFVADRLGLYVDTVYSNYEYYSGGTCFLASLFYSLQIYCDFAGYSLMAIGVGSLLGFNLINNFNRPYFAQSVTEFWHRWHISLSLWLKDYIYIPLGGSRCSKLRSYLNILATFLVSGIWHGANLTFIVWGGIHGLLQIAEKFLGLHKRNSRGIIKAFRILLTFLIIDIVWIFFRMPTISSAIDVCRKIFTDFGGELYKSTNTSFFLMLLGVTMILLKEFFDEYFPKRLRLFDNKSIIVRYTSYLIILSLILLFGVFDSTQFIYVSF
ncbi:MAG: MBOAT family protein [Bacteroidaceae bacterium]|nr:MBOAT family protein [Bacteroidaceae bacterium]